MSDPTRTFLPQSIVASGAADIGCRRKHNEDTVLLRPDLQLYILADGAGGHNAGNVASALAATAIANFFESAGHGRAEEPDNDGLGLPIVGRRLAAALQKANDDVLEIAKTSNKLKGMGTTAVAVAFLPQTGMAHVAHVGDSRCYRWRDGVLEQLTHDHSLINDALEMRPNMDDEQLAKLPANVVTRALGMEPQIRVSVRPYRTLAGDKYLLCSDGLTDALEDDVIADLLAVQRTPEETVRALIARANDNDANDNVGVVVMNVSLSNDASAHVKPRPPSRMPPPKKATSDDSSPEIVILGYDAESDMPDMRAPMITVVPTDSADDSIIEVLEDFTKKPKPG